MFNSSTQIHQLNLLRVSYHLPVFELMLVDNFVYPVGQEAVLVTNVISVIA